MNQERLVALVERIERFSAMPPEVNPEGLPSIDYAREHPNLSESELREVVAGQRSRFLRAINHLFSDPTELNNIVLEALERMENPRSLAFKVPEIINIFNGNVPMLDEKFTLDLSETSMEARKTLRQSRATKNIFSMSEIRYSLEMVQRDPSVLEVPNTYFTLVGYVLEGVKGKYEKKNPGAHNTLFRDIQSESWGNQTTISQYIVPALCVCSKVLSKDCFDPDVCRSAVDFLNKCAAFEKNVSDSGRSFKVYCPAQQFINKILCDTTVFLDMQKIFRTKIA